MYHYFFTHHVFQGRLRVKITINSTYSLQMKQYLRVYLNNNANYISQNAHLGKTTW